MSPLYCFQFFIFSLCVHLFTLFSYFVYYSDRFYPNQDVKEKYDYIIVGSGTAGSVIAHRLATETNYSFILLEAGSRGHTLLEIPVLGPFLHRSVFDWQYESVPQKHACLAMKNNKCRLFQGKIVGGSSKLNNMIHVRGNISHYVDWFNGRYSEWYIEEQFEFIEKYLINLGDIQYQSELSDVVLEAAKELGYTILSGVFQEGFMKSKVSQKNGKRWAISDNLLSKHIVSNAFVENIMFDSNTATGVIVNVHGRKYNILARNGVIISAGAINTPKILQLSGIGPERLLNKLKIPIVKVLPVGKNLQDHVATGLDLVLFNNSVSVQALDMVNPLNAFKYFLKGKGPMTTPGCEVIGFVDTENNKIPDVQFMVMAAGLSSDRGSLLSKNVGVTDDVWYKYFSKHLDKYAVTILPVVLHPKSRGEVYISSNDPYKPPLIDPNYLSSQEDIDTLTKGLRIMIKLVETNALKSLGAHLNTTPFPGCENHTLFSNSYFECYIRHLTLTSYHPVGTCSMGLPDAKNTVVDVDFRVLGIKKLYVADASVLPTLPSGNINAAVAMMASIFFDTNIESNRIKEAVSYCYKNVFLYECLFYVCSVR